MSYQYKEATTDNLSKYVGHTVYSFNCNETDYNQYNGFILISAKNKENDQIQLLDPNTYNIIKIEHLDNECIWKLYPPGKDFTVNLKDDSIDHASQTKNPKDPHLLFLKPERGGKRRTRHKRKRSRKRISRRNKKL